MNNKDERLEILLSELGDITPRSVGGPGGGTIPEGEWAANQIAQYGVAAILPLAARIQLTDLIESGNSIVLNQFGFHDSEIAKNWVINVRIDIQRAYEKIPEAVQYLQAELKNENSTIRSISAIALGFLRSSSAIEPLITAMSDTNNQVQKSALLALKKIRGRSFLFGNRNPEKWRRWLIRKYHQ